MADNLNTHSIGSLYEAFPPAKALDLAKRLEIHHTPKHGSWLNIAEIELNVMAMQCLDRRISDLAQMNKILCAWEDHRNRAAKTVSWHFTTGHARDKLKYLYHDL